MADSKEPLGYAGNKATRTKLGIERFASLQESNAGILRDVGISPYTLAQRLIGFSAAPGAIGATTPAAGTFTQVGFGGTGGPLLLSGAGAPSLSAPKGSLYSNTTAATAATRLYINTDGATTWAAFTAAA
jgi:hypothetical protein